jgi:hypothetical protein
MSILAGLKHIDSFIHRESKTKCFYIGICKAYFDADELFDTEKTWKNREKNGHHADTRHGSEPTDKRFLCVGDKIAICKLEQTAIANYHGRIDFLNCSCGRDSCSESEHPALYVRFYEGPAEAHCEKKYVCTNIK